MEVVRMQTGKRALSCRSIHIDFFSPGRSERNNTSFIAVSISYSLAITAAAEPTTHHSSDSNSCLPASTITIASTWSSFRDEFTVTPRLQSDSTSFPCIFVSSLSTSSLANTTTTAGYSASNPGISSEQWANPTSWQRCCAGDFIQTCQGWHSLSTYRTSNQITKVLLRFGDEWTFHGGVWVPVLLIPEH